MKHHFPTYIEIDKKALLHNYKTIRSLLGEGVLLAPCVKANAYGHGLVDISLLLQEYGVDWLSVFSIAEGKILRSSKIKVPIQVLGGINTGNIKDLFLYNLIPFISSKNELQTLLLEAKRTNKHLDVVLKVDTGMSRFGVYPSEVLDILSYAGNQKLVKIISIATHFGSSDEVKDNKRFLDQFELFNDLRNKIKDKYSSIIFQCANSAATLVYPNSHFDLVRPGISIYGYFPSKYIENECRTIDLYPVLKLKSSISVIRTVKENVYISYGYSYNTTKPCKIAVVPIGYSNGLPRLLSNRFKILVNSKFVPIVGKICMNALMVDITKIGKVSVGDEVIIIGKQGVNTITAQDIAECLGTIHYEVLTNLDSHIPKVFV
ncbi:MAG: alanine racemase [bacterium]|nr:alanine racemase [bacterium]